jgi:hypothetical protein
MVDYISSEVSSPVTLIKHDVECNPLQALKIAEIEASFGIKATYYFQKEILYERPDVVCSISRLGHEIAYHYDVLDECNGDIEMAIEKFSIVLNDFSQLGFIVRTVCPHGNPIKNRVGWDSNKDFFRSVAVRDMFPAISDVVVDSAKLFGSDFRYITDAGYGWKLVGAIDENDRKNIADLVIDDLVQRLSLPSSVTILSSHPHRWFGSSTAAWLKRSTFYTVRFLAVKASRFEILNEIMSKYFALARKF